MLPLHVTLVKVKWYLVSRVQLLSEKSELMIHNLLPPCEDGNRSPRHVCIKCIPADMASTHETQPTSSIRGQIDTGATVSCSNAKHLFHNHRECNHKFKSPVRLCAAADRKRGDIVDPNSSVIPEGKGLLLIPALNRNGCIPVRAFYSPHLTSTPIGDDCVMGSTKREHDQFESQCLLKCLSTASFTMVCHHK